MSNDITSLSCVVVWAVMACWGVFAVLFVFRTRPPRATHHKRNLASLLGVALVGVGYALVWFLRRPMCTPLFRGGVGIDAAVAVITILLAIWSVWMILSAVRTLGRQWSVAAQLVDDHQLVRDGAYSIVRHPIYAGMLGMMLSTGLALSEPVWVVCAGVVAWLGTSLRIRSEETLLQEAFGEQYRKYARAVPALIPRIRRRPVP